VLRTKRGNLETEVQDVYLARKPEFCNGMHNLSLFFIILPYGQRKREKRTRP